MGIPTLWDIITDLTEIGTDMRGLLAIPHQYGEMRDAVTDLEGRVTSNRDVLVDLLGHPPDTYSRDEIHA